MRFFHMIVSFESSFKRSLHLRNAGFTTVRKSFHCEGYSPLFFSVVRLGWIQIGFWGCVGNGV